MELFQQWRKQHGKSYENSEELFNRFQSFKSNLKYIVESNSNRTGYWMGLNRFSDMSNEEFREKYIGKVKGLVELSEGKHTRERSVLICDAPPSLDWREKEVVTPVKDQGVCGNVSPPLLLFCFYITYSLGHFDYQLKEVFGKIG